MAVASLIVVAVADVLLWPEQDLGILYPIPACIAALRLTPGKVAIVQFLAVAAYVVVVRTQSAAPTWPISLSAIVVLGAFAVLLAAQRQQNAQLHDQVERVRSDIATSRNNLQRFLGMVAHDLRAPLAVLSAHAELLADSAPETSSADHLRSIDGIRRATERIKQFSIDLLDTARIGTGHFAVQPEPMDLVEMIREVIEQQRVITSRHTVILRAADQVKGEWDRARIAQVLTNLISNAITYSDEGEVRVTVQRTGPKVVVAVSDEGIGIAPDKQKRLFDPFARLADEPERSGTGLGLYITKGIVDAHRGRIWVESRPGKGSTFFVELPVKHARQSSAGHDGGKARQTPSAG